MAVVTGLVMGTIALASLYSVCIELFDVFELSRNYGYDYRLACTKISLLRARFYHWGGTLKVEEQGTKTLLFESTGPQSRILSVAASLESKLSSAILRS